MFLRHFHEHPAKSLLCYFLNLRCYENLDVTVMWMCLILIQGSCAMHGTMGHGTMVEDHSGLVLDWAFSVGAILSPMRHTGSWGMGEKNFVAQTVNNLPAMQETQVWPLGQEDFLEKRMTIHSSIPAWRIPGIEEPDGLQSWSHRESDMTEQPTHKKQRRLQYTHRYTVYLRC